MKRTFQGIAGTPRAALLSLVLLSGAFQPARAQQAPAFGAAHDGVTVDCGTFGRFTLTYPTLDVGSDKPLAPVEVTATDGKAKLRYAGDAEVDVSVEPDGKVSYAFLNPPAGLKTYRVTMLIDAGFSQGGKWQIGSASGTAFPAEKPPKPQLFQGNASAFTLSSFEGKHLAFGIPPYSYEEITDNREWGWKIFSWMFVAPFDKNNPRGTVTVREDVSGAKPVVLADRFGQDAASEFPGKVKSEAELPQDVTRDAAYYAGFHPPLRDTYGGLPHSGGALGLAPTGYFHVQKGRGNRKNQWFLVDPAGNADLRLM